jgi:hypothetical protein
MPGGEIIPLELRLCKRSVRLKMQRGREALRACSGAQASTNHLFVCAQAILSRAIRQNVPAGDDRSSIPLQKTLVLL